MSLLPMSFLKGDPFASPESLFMAKAIADSVKPQSGRVGVIVMNAQIET
jgi:hypothetical protein